MCCSISPGNVMTPLWEELAAQTPNAAAAVRAGENSQVKIRNRSVFRHPDKVDCMDQFFFNILGRDVSNFSEVHVEESGSGNIF